VRELLQAIEMAIFGANGIGSMRSLRGERQFHGDWIRTNGMLFARLSKTMKSLIPKCPILGEKEKDGNNGARLNKTKPSIFRRRLRPANDIS
jgi:hypothetical protein